MTGSELEFPALIACRAVQHMRRSWETGGGRQTRRQVWHMSGGREMFPSRAEAVGLENTCASKSRGRRERADVMKTRN